MVNKKVFKTISQCRSCLSKNLIPIFSLGEYFVSNFVNEEGQGSIKVPLELVLCNAKSGGCGLLQLKHTTSPGMLYTQNYWYRSGVNKTMTQELTNITWEAERMVNLSDGDLVLDIGCNDGTLLRAYQTKELKLVGFEPASNLLKYAGIGTTKIIVDFFNYPAFKKAFSAQKAKIITAIAMFYDLDNPNEFIEGVVKCLDPEGILIIQQNYLLSMLSQNAFDNIVHEHLEYYSLISLKHLLERHGLEIFKVKLNDINGGSFRTYIKHKSCQTLKISEEVRKIEKQEYSFGLDNLKTYQEFAKQVASIKERLYNFIKSQHTQAKTFYLYGASTRGNTILQFCNLDHKLITAAAERNPDKWGKKIVGTLIPIVSEEKMRKDRPHYLLVLPWFFIEEFIEREIDYLKTGGKFLIPLPIPKIISYQNGKIEAHEI